MLAYTNIILKILSKSYTYFYFSENTIQTILLNFSLKSTKKLLNLQK